MAEYTQRLLPPELKYLAPDRRKRHYNYLLYCKPVPVPGYKFPPKMIPISKFGGEYSYSKAQVLSLMAARQLFALTFKKWTFVCPNPACFNQDIILNFWEPI